MNNTPNYPYLAGYLESSIKRLADDYNFLKMENFEDRKQYINKIVREAFDGAVKHGENN